MSLKKKDKAQTLRPKQTATQKRNERWGWLFILPWAIGTLYFFIIPMCQAAIYAFNDIEMKNGTTNFTWVKVPVSLSLSLARPWLKWPTKYLLLWCSVF